MAMSKAIYDASKDAVCDEFLPSETLKDFKKEQGKFTSMAHDKLGILRVLLVCLHMLSGAIEVRLVRSSLKTFSISLRSCFSDDLLATHL